jgi:hypothetical protein
MWVGENNGNHIWALDALSSRWCTESAGEPRLARSDCSFSPNCTHLLVAAFVGEGPVVIGLDDTIERQWGTKIKARGICKGRMKFPQMWRVKIPQTVCLVTVCLVMDGCLAESTSFSVAVPGGAVEVERG